MQTILVQMSERGWTMQALHLACALAHNQQAQIVLLRLISVRHPSYLGTPLGNSPLTQQERESLSEYTATAEDYNVRFSLQAMQCITTLDALADAAEHLDANIVFAHIPPSRVPYWQRYQTWQLEHRLASAHCQLFTLDGSSSRIDTTPSVIITPARMQREKEDVR